MTVVGTRPEIIRLSRTIARFDATFDHVLVHTGQNYDRELNEVFFDDLKLRPVDRYLGIDTSSIGRMLGGVLVAVEDALRQVRPDAFVVLGDTNSAISAVIAKRLHIPTYHMEAGNRAFDANVPEEVNRRIVDHVADYNLVYTEAARRHLLSEGIPSWRITLTGSPMAEVLAHYSSAIDASTVLEELDLAPGEYVLVSAHREENVDSLERLSQLVAAMEAVYERFGRPVLVTTHPRTRKRLSAAGFEDIAGVRFHPPFGYLDYNRLQKGAFCVISDSGTVAEEASILGFPAVTPREAIERPEALETGVILTCGTRPNDVCNAVAHVVEQRASGDVPTSPVGYQIPDCSLRVTNLVRSTVPMHRERFGLRGGPPWATAGSGMDSRLG